MNKEKIFSQKYKKTLKECSCDNSDSKKEYMTDSNLEVINFDLVKNDYIASFGTEGVLSNDVLFIKDLEKEEFMFIEFKNGKIDVKIEFELRKKIYDSLLIFCDIFDLNIKNTRENMIYILVYNNTKEHIERSDVNFCNNLLISAKFGLGKFKGYCFKNVYTYSKEEFEENFVKKYENK